GYPKPRQSLGARRAELRLLLKPLIAGSPLAENSDLSFAHPNLNEGRFDIEPTSDDSGIDTEGALKLQYGHGSTPMRLAGANSACCATCISSSLARPCRSSAMSMS